MKTITSAAAIALILLQTLFVPGAFAQAPLQSGPVVNGGFETGDLTGWAHVEQGSGDWSVHNGTVAPHSGYTIPAPPEGQFAATTDQTGPGAHMLFQDVVVPTGSNATLSFLLSLENRAGSYWSPPTFNVSNGSNQQFRADIMRTNSSADSLAPGDILANVYQTQPGDAMSLPPSRICFDMTPFEGQSVRLRFAEAENVYFFQVGIDDVQIVSDCVATPPPPSSADLVIEAINAASPVIDGNVAEVFVRFGNQGNAAAAGNVTLAVRLDGITFARVPMPSGMPAGWNSTFVARTVVSGVGTHEIEAVIDVDGNVTESNETNNRRVAFIQAISRPDIRIKHLEIRPVFIPTDAGPVRHPQGRYDATVETCNNGTAPSASGGVQLSLRGGHDAAGNGSVAVGTAGFGSRFVPALSTGACSIDHFQFDTPGVIGDFTLDARLFVPNDGPAGNNASARGFRVVGDQGGVVVPVGTQLVLDIPAALGQAQRNTEATLAQVQAIAQNAPPAVVAAVNNATAQVSATVDAAVRTAQNASGQLGPTIANVVATAQNATAQWQDDPTAAGLNLTESGVCQVIVAACAASRGEPTLVIFGQPCSAREPLAQQNLLVFVVWYAVHAYEQRALFQPESRPLNQPWPVPHTPLPIPDAAPAMCRNLWEDARGVEESLP